MKTEKTHNPANEIINCSLNVKFPKKANKNAQGAKPIVVAII